MIDKREIIDTATALGLTPHVVEKDHVLGWLLWGIRDHRAVGDRWAFKGGTCLKKCFFETYRFSEDLDFTLDDPSHAASEADRTPNQNNGLLCLLALRHAATCPCIAVLDGDELPAIR